MTPYYADDGITIYNADCRELLPHLSADLIITDPPYNAGMPYDYYDDAMPADEYRDWCLSWWSLLPTQKRLLFPGWGNQVWWASFEPTTMACWYKPGNPALRGPFQWNEFELIYVWGMTFSGSNVLRVPVSKQRGTGEHPCPKPLSLMRSLVGRLRTPGSILDPFMGSGSTLVAAREIGREAIGIELSERYCEVAARRLSQGMLPLGIVQDA